MAAGAGAAAVALAAQLACLPSRLPPGSDEELICAVFLNCWYPGESGSQFDPNDPNWAGMANDDNEQNIRRAYGTDGTCWQVDPMAGTSSDDEPVDARALAESCGSACACTILELCDDQTAADVPDCAAGATNPCDDASIADACAMCESADAYVACESL